MIFADKLIQLRKKCGWTQEELAEKLAVTRQAVSKWEGAQSIPELDKILQISTLFGVSTDYLLRDEIEACEPAESLTETSAVRRVSMEEASAFLDTKRAIAKPYALAVFLCILSPAPMLLLMGAAEARAAGERTAALAGGVGIILLLLFVAAAVGVFLWCENTTKRYAFLETEDFETEYGVTGMVRARQEQFRPQYLRHNILGTVLCVLSPVPLFCGAFLSEDALRLTALLCCLILLAGTGVVVLVVGGTYWGAMEQLLEEGDYTRRSKRVTYMTRYVAPAYWVTAVALYVGYSFFTNDWKNSWIVWPVVGLLFVPVRLVTRALAERRTEERKF